MTRRAFDTAGQSLIEFSLVLPLILMLALGVVEVGYALLDQHVVTKLSREGANLISRDTPIDQALVALTSMSTRPIDFSNGSKVIFSVVRKGATLNTPNYNEDILYQRFEYGTLAGAGSALTTSGSGSFTGPDHTALASDTNTGLQLTYLPPDLEIPLGGMVYVTEIFSRHVLLTPLDRLGVTVPDRLYSIAYF
jgi:hypothetical protein